jgi:hypothetical protein
MAEHPLVCRSIETQCPFVTPNGDDSYLNCALEAGHQSLGFKHVDRYEAHRGETQSTWHTTWIDKRTIEGL